jgi:Fe-S cluster biosynthesis and repair protein YggX
MSEPLMVHCKKLGKELPGLAKPPYKNELGKRIYEEISKEAWDEWIQHSVRYVNTYFGPGRLDITTKEGQEFLFKQAAIFFGFEEGDLADTAYTPKDEPK